MIFYLGFDVMSLTAADMLDSESRSMSSWMPPPLSTTLLMFRYWSPKKGMPMTGLPKYTASIVLDRPPWMITAITFLCSEIGVIFYITQLHNKCLHLTYNFSHRPIKCGVFMASTITLEVFIMSLLYMSLLAYAVAAGQDS